MPYGLCVQNHSRARGHQSICMKLLVSECGHVGLIACNELIEIVELSAKAGVNMVVRKESDGAIERLKSAGLRVNEREVSAASQEISSLPFRSCSVRGQSA